MGQRHLTDDSMRLCPELLGQPLASARRRLAAIVADWAVLLVPSIVLVAAAAMMSLWLTDRTALRALAELVRADEISATARHELLREVAPLLVRTGMPGVPSEAVAAVDRNDPDAAARMLEAHDLLFAVRIGGGSDEESAPGQIRVEVDRFIPRWARAVVSYGIAAVYFTLFTAWASGATLGKRAVGIRVVRLDGGALGLLASFERFLGYWQIPASLGIALLDLWRDPNRRLPHDRLVHTAVLGPAGDGRGRKWRRVWRRRARSFGRTSGGGAAARREPASADGEDWRT